MTKPPVAIGDGSGYHSGEAAFGANYTDFYRGYICVAYEAHLFGYQCPESGCTGWEVSFRTTRNIQSLLNGSARLYIM